MQDKGDIIFHIEGISGGQELSPDTFDISDLKDFLAIVDKMLRNVREEDSAPVTYHPEHGSMKARFCTSLETAAKFSAILALATATSGIDSLNAKTAGAIEEMQDYSRKRGYTIGLSTTFDGKTLTISPVTSWSRSSNCFADAELYLYGKVLQYGGRDKGHIRFETKGVTYSISADTAMMEGWEENHYMREYAIRVKAKQNVYTGEIRKDSLRLIEMVDYTRKKNEAYLKRKIQQATPRWAGVDTDAFLREIREEAYV